MSGFAGVVTSDGHRPDSKLLDRMARCLQRRGPDGSQVHGDDQAGLVHTLLTTGASRPVDAQPRTWDGGVWITSDCRLDAREELIAQLRAKGRVATSLSSDSELILHAYSEWAEKCVEHLLGDFSFAIWDARRRRLFCARDHFGLKLFYYSASARGILFSNTLNAIRLDAAVPTRRNEPAICDFLMFSVLLDRSATVFDAIQCLPGGHTLTWEAGRVQTRRYWRLPVDEPVRFRRAADYVDRLEELVKIAVADRLQDSSTAIIMSGGLDSTILAATAKRVAGNPVEAHCAYYSEVIPDDERRYASLAADHIGVPVRFTHADSWRPYQGWPEIAGEMPQPDHRPMAAFNREFYRGIAGHTRVAFYGEGPDNLLKYEWRHWVSFLRSQGRTFDALRDVARSFWMQKRIPFLFRMQRRVTQPRYEAAGFPGHIRPELIERHSLRERWRAYWEDRVDSPHPYHPRAWHSMSYPNWDYMFTHADAGVTGFAVEVRQPFLDLRVARYLLALPVIPWCRHKLILRRLAARMLPPEVHQRRKTPLAGDPVAMFAERGALRELPDPGSPELSEYISAMPEIDTRAGWSSTLSLTPFSLGYWFQQQAKRGAPL